MAKARFRKEAGLCPFYFRLASFLTARVPFAQVLELVVESAVAFMPPSDDPAIFYGLTHRAALFLCVTAPDELAVAKVGRKVQKALGQLFFELQIEPRRLERGKARCVDDLRAAG